MKKDNQSTIQLLNEPVLVVLDIFDVVSMALEIISIKAIFESIT